MSLVKLALAQYPLVRHLDFKAFEISVEKWVEEASANQAQMLIFPEYGSLEMTSFFDSYYQSHLIEQISEIGRYHSKFRELYQNLAIKYKVYILAPSIPILINEKNINRAYFYNPQGLEKYQDKLTMTRFEDEKWQVQSGDSELFIFDTPFGMIGINICFDSEFPQLAYELAQEGVKLIVVPSCTESLWGLSRVHIGSRARALENQIYVATCSTVGEADWSEAVDKNTGQVGIFGPADHGFPSDGLIQLGELNKPGWVYSTLDFDKITEVRKNGHVFNFRKMNQFMIRNPKIKMTRVKF